MNYARYWFVVSLAASLAWAGCKKNEATPAGTNASAGVVADAGTGTGAGTGAGAGADASAGTGAGAGAGANAGSHAHWSGEATGQGADPPIHEFVQRVRADEWNGTGTVSLDVADGDGPVAGSLALTGIVFRVNGFRTGAHVRGTLEQSGGDAGVGVDGGERGEEVYRGTLDAEIAGDTLRGTWEASAQAGMHRRRGTVTARR